MKRNDTSIRVNSIANAILTMSGFVFPLITFPYVSRVLHPIGVGRVAFASSVVSYFLSFSQLGIPTYGIRICAKLRDDKRALSKTVHELFLISFFMASITFAILICLIITVPRFRSDRVLLLISGSSVMLSAFGMEWLYKGLEKYTYIAIRSIGFKVIAIISMFAFVRSESDCIKYAAISVIAASGSYILNFINSKSIILYEYFGNYELKKHFKGIGVFFAMTCAAMIYTHLDIVMLGFLKNDLDVGYYNAAVKIKTILVSIVTSISAVVLPRVSYYIEHGSLDEFRRMANRTLRFVVFAAIPMVVYFTLFAEEGILFLSGSAYEPSIAPMQVIMPTVLCIGITNIFGIQMLVPMGKERYVLYSEIIGAVIDLLLNSVFIPRYGALGAAIGTLVAEIAVLLYQVYAIRDELVFLSKGMGILRYGLYAVVAALGCLWVKLIGMNDFFTLLLSGGIFFGVYLLCAFVSKDEMVKVVFARVRVIDKA